MLCRQDHRAQLSRDASLQDAEAYEHMNGEDDDDNYAATQGHFDDAAPPSGHAYMDSQPAQTAASQEIVRGSSGKAEVSKGI